VLQGKSLSQVDPDQEDDEIGAEELAELDTYLINACEDLVSALASVLGRDFAPTFKEFLPLIAQYYVRHSERKLLMNSHYLFIIREQKERPLIAPAVLVALVKSSPA
jgi:hypothetical protein